MALLGSQVFWLSDQNLYHWFIGVWTWTRSTPSTLLANFISWDFFFFFLMLNFILNLSLCSPISIHPSILLVLFPPIHLPIHTYILLILFLCRNLTNTNYLHFPRRENKHKDWKHSPECVFIIAKQALEKISPWVETLCSNQSIQI